MAVSRGLAVLSALVLLLVSLPVLSAGDVPEELAAIAQRKLDLGKLLLASGTNTQQRQELLTALATATVQQHRMGRDLHLSAVTAGERDRSSALETTIFSTALLVLGAAGGFAIGYATGLCYKCTRTVHSKIEQLTSVQYTAVDREQRDARPGEGAISEHEML
jgi:hypothetical protein